MNLERPVMAFAGLLLLAACGDTGPVTAPAHEPPAIPVVEVGATGATALSWEGVVEATRQARVVAQTPGRVTAVAVDVGDRVAAGQLLLRLSDVEQQSALRAATAQRQAAEAALREASARFERSASLVMRQLVSRADHDLATAAHEAALAMRDATLAQERAAREQLGYAQVRAPYAGVVQQRLVEPGEAVGVGQPLLVVHAPGELRVVLQLPERLAGALRGQPFLEVQWPDGTLLRTGRPVLFPSSDPQAHTQTVRAPLPSVPAGVQPGTTLRMVLPAAAAAGPAAPLRVPRAAVQQRGEVSAVYVVTAQGISLRQLRLGASHGDEVEVLAGLVAGERVARDPVEALGWLKARRQARGAGHE